MPGFELGTSESWGEHITTTPPHHSIEDKTSFTTATLTLAHKGPFTKGVIHRGGGPGVFQKVRPNNGGGWRGLEKQNVICLYICPSEGYKAN